VLFDSFKNLFFHSLFNLYSLCSGGFKVFSPIHFIILELIHVCVPFSLLFLFSVMCSLISLPVGSPMLSELFCLPETGKSM
jgi:hypothetical protein